MSIITQGNITQYEINAPGQERVGGGAQPYQPGPMPELGETLRVVSMEETVTLRFDWNSRPYVIPPGGEAYMPFDAVKLYTGDPRSAGRIATTRDSIGIVSFLADRATEVRRLRLLYAAPFGEYMSGQDLGGIFLPDVASRSEFQVASAWKNVRIPKVAVYNIAGQQIITVLDDPAGTLSIPVSVTAAQMDQQTQYMGIIEGQRRLIEVMADRLGIDPNSPALDNTPDLLNENPPEDDSDVETHEDGTPKMVYDQRDEQIKPRRRPRPADPTTIDDLPEDRI